MVGRFVGNFFTHMDKQQKIKSQVEFYFSDANFRVDKFLREQALLNGGFVPIETIVSFKRLKDLEATVDDVKEALRGSSVVEVKDGLVKKIETEEYLSYVMDKNISKRVVHISGFEKDAALEDIRDILQPHMTPVLIRMRRDKAKNFTGGVFVELASEKEAEEVVSKEIRVREIPEEAAKKQKSEERYLMIMRKEEYALEKEKTSAERKEKDAREALEKDFVPRLFRYESKDDLDIGAIRKMVKNTAFVDVQKKVVRMKHVEDFEEKTFEDEGRELVLTKMKEEDAREYCKGINVAPPKRGARPKKE